MCIRDSLTYQSGDSLTPLGLGTTGQVLQVNAGAPAWTTPSPEPNTMANGKTTLTSVTAGDQLLVIFTINSPSQTSNLRSTHRNPGGLARLGRTSLLSREQRSKTCSSTRCRHRSLWEPSRPS